MLSQEWISYFINYIISFLLIIWILYIRKEIKIIQNGRNNSCGKQCFPKNVNLVGVIGPTGSTGPMGSTGPTGSIEILLFVCV